MHSNLFSLYLKPLAFQYWQQILKQYSNTIFFNLVYMNFKNLIQASANVIQITQLAKWDTFKMIKEETYGWPKLKFGIVTDIMNDWDKWYVTAIVLEAWYSNISKSVVLLSEKEMENTAIFPTTWEEIKVAMSESIESMTSKIKDDTQSLKKKEEDLVFAKSILSGDFVITTQVPKFIETPF